MSAGTAVRRELGASTKTSHGRLAAFLAQPILLEEVGPSRVILHLILLIGLSLVGFLVWAAITNLNETAKTTGQILPAGSIHVVQHLEGGIVEGILVAEGQIVASNDVLLKLSPFATRSELQALEARRAALALSARRLRAFSGEQPADFSGFDAYADLVADQEALLEAQIAARTDQLDVLLSRMEQRRIEFQQLRARRENLARQVQIINEKLVILDHAMSGKAVSRFEYLDAKAELTRTEDQFETIAADQNRVAEAIAEAERSILELDSKLRGEALNELNGVSAELREVDEALGKLQDRALRLEVRATHAGIVKGLTVKTVGGVIEPGVTLMEIVPLDEVMVAEVRILPADIGHIEVGQRADVSITTFDVKQFGLLEGRVQRLSASTFISEDGDPYYIGIIELDRNHVGEEPATHPIVPGMIVNADIRTGQKTMLRYLVKPIDRALRASFSER